jgi:hypothetical protein
VKRVSSALTRLGIVGTLLLLFLALGSATVSAHGGEPSKDSYAVAQLRHTPTGTAQVVYYPYTGTTVVTVSETGLQPKSVHPLTMDYGSCAAPGSLFYILNRIVADKNGNGTSRTVLPTNNLQSLSSVFSLDVYAGPTLNTAPEQLPISCGDVVFGTPTPYSQGVLVATSLLGTSNADNQDAYGYANLTLHNGTLTVTVSEFNLVPNSSHMEHIHAGSCEAQVPGNIVYSLNTLTADGSGYAYAKTVIHNVKSIPKSGWYINVHFGTDLSTQAGYDAVDCGNVALK